MAQDANNLIWLDMEMTGLDPDRDRVIEIAMVATDSVLNTLAESPVVVVHQPAAVLDAIRTSPMCGNSICQDRRFMARWLPGLEGYFHYRNLDVSTLKELARRWKPEVYKGVVKKGAHTALADIHESIEELRYYRDNFIKL